ncbi:hypothetical protein [Eikenella glucosivorans]|nr:hypothetical protein [Eikenella glucosivorans]
MKQPCLLTISPDSLILFDNGRDNFLKEFHQAFADDAIEGEYENLWYLLGTDAFFAVRENQLVLQDWDDKTYFSLPLSEPLNLADNCGVMLIDTPEPVDAATLQAAFGNVADDNEALSQALFDFEAQNGWSKYDCRALCICLFNKSEQEQMKQKFDLA